MPFPVLQVFLQQKRNGRGEGEQWWHVERNGLVPGLEKGCNYIVSLIIYLLGRDFFNRFLISNFSTSNY